MQENIERKFLKAAQFEATRILGRVCAKCLNRTIRQCWLERYHWRFCQQIKCASRHTHAAIILKIAAHTHYKE